MTPTPPEHLISHCFRLWTWSLIIWEGLVFWFLKKEPFCVGWYPPIPAAFDEIPPVWNRLVFLNPFWTLKMLYILTRPSALGKSDPFCGPSNPWHLFTKDYTIFCGPSNPQYLFPKDYAIFFWQIIDINKKFCTVSINFLLQLFKSFSFLG